MIMRLVLSPNFREFPWLWDLPKAERTQAGHEEKKLPPEKARPRNA